MEKNSVNLAKEFFEFGKKMQIIGILTVISIFFSGLLEIVIIILLLMSLGNVKRIYSVAYDENLKKFRSSITHALIIQIVGFGILVTITSIIAVTMMGFFPTSSQMPSASFLTGLINFGVSIGIMGVVVWMLSTMFMMSSWSNLNTFFINNDEVFTGDLGHDVRKGSKYLRTSYLLELFSCAAVLMLLVILMNALPTILQGIISAGDQYVPNINAFMPLIVAVAIPGAAVGVLMVCTTILEIAGYLKLSKVRYINFQ